MNRIAKKSRRGQVLLVAIAIMLILLVVLFFIVDLQGVVRSRMKTQTAADAAALSAAAWQGRSLNMIGELNLIKASTALITDVTPIDDDSEEGLLESVRVLSQLQTRISYAGPLIGYASAQQAALRNGMRPVDAFTSSLNTHINNYVDGGIYEEVYPETTEDGYEWLNAYSNMLHQIAAGGISAKPLNSRYLMGVPQLSGEAAFLAMQPGFYDAVHAHYYCWFYRQGLEPTDEFNFADIEYNTNQSPFFPGSEFLPLYIAFQQGPPRDELIPYLDSHDLAELPTDQEGRDDITWAVFDDSGDGYGWDETGLYDFTNNYLRTPFQESYTYSGAAARFYCTSKPALITGDWRWEHGREPGAGGASLGNALSWSDTDFGEGSFSDNANRLKNAENSLAGLRGSEVIDSTAAAKPFGKLGDNAPHEIDLILPVFSEVRLVPNVVVRQNDMERDPSFYIFIIEYFGHPEYPSVPEDVIARHWYYVSAIWKFEDMSSDFRLGWYEYDIWRDEHMAGDDLIPDTDDDRRDPCEPEWGGGGGGGGGGSGGGPPVLH